MTTPRNATLGALGVAGIAAAALATGSLLVESAPTTVGGTAQSAHPSQVELACPRPRRSIQHRHVAPAATWSPLSAAPITPAPGLDHGYRRNHSDGSDAGRPGWR